MRIIQELLSLDQMSKSDNLNILRRKNQAFKEWRKNYEQTMESVKTNKEEREEWGRVIKKECEEMTETLGKLKQKSKEFINHCREALEDSKRNQEIISVGELANYLKAEKAMLKSMAEQGQVQQSTGVNLHEMLGKIELERSLRRAKKAQLQEEIKFLEGNVLVKGNFIYNPASSLLISPAEQKENNAKLLNLVAELERVVKLSIPCASSSNGVAKLSLLSSQGARLQQCDALLGEQRQKLTRFSQFVSERKEAQYRFSFDSIPTLNESNQQPEKQYTQLKINEAELDRLLEAPPIASLIISKQHSFASLQASIASLRDRIRKAEKLL